ncbi:MAG: bifunctional 5,10-methylenetetrahydrofolate dehydrogenase/5,10-methenyltetrahydrofolate cyclohydrolase [Candidatus Colwellbacteria bacterium]|nr:bifunctional 5,10-methylenetetrahydrofolate dehydrogenase/5,10-methenyltetrahydrofolate cyclohydrolase [Candidatus Colwellbacteria bacterium]
MQKILGKEISKDIVKKLKSFPVPNKILAAVLIGNDPTSISFLAEKEKIAKELGVDFRVYDFPEDSSNDDLRKKIGKLARQGSVGGVIVQLPLPEGVNKYYVVSAIPREKDVDVLGERALGAFYNDRNPVLPPAIEVVKELVQRTSFKLESAKVAVIGLGALVGKPISVWLIGKCAELYLLGRGSDLKVIQKADLVISGVGKAGIVNAGMMKAGAGIIDFGYYYFPDGGLSGDFAAGDSEEMNKLSFYTPTPGGTGPILVAKLFENFFTLNND